MSIRKIAEKIRRRKLKDHSHPRNLLERKAVLISNRNRADKKIDVERPEWIKKGASTVQFTNELDGFIAAMKAG